MKPYICPQCGAQIDIKVPSDIIKCHSCGTSFSMKEKTEKNIHYINNYYNGTAINIEKHDTIERILFYIENDESKLNDEIAYYKKKWPRDRFGYQIELYAHCLYVNHKYEDSPYEIEELLKKNNDMLFQTQKNNLSDEILIDNVIPNYDTFINEIKIYLEQHVLTGSKYYQYKQYVIETFKNFKQEYVEKRNVIYLKKTKEQKKLTVSIFIFFFITSYRFYCK